MLFIIERYKENPSIKGVNLDKINPKKYRLNRCISQQNHYHKQSWLWVYNNKLPLSFIDYMYIFTFSISSQVNFVDTCAGFLEVVKVWKSVQAVYSNCRLLLIVIIYFDSLICFSLV